MKIVYNGEMDSRQFKNEIGATVEKLMQEDDRLVWLDADLMGCSGTKGMYGKSDRILESDIKYLYFSLTISLSCIDNLPSTTSNTPGT